MKPLETAPPAPARPVPPARAASSPVVRIRPERGWRLPDLPELWAYRELLWVLARRDVRVRYRQTLLGAGWAVIRPLLAMILFSVVFGRLARLPSEGVPYPVFVYAGLLPWTLFATVVAAAGSSMTSSASLVGKVYFPRLVLPFATVGVALADHLVAIVVLFAMMLWFGVPFAASLLAAPLLIVALALLALALGILVAALAVNYRDVQQLLPFALQLGMFASPVVYPVTLVPADWRWLLYLNPMTALIEGYRAAFLGRPLAWGAVAVAFAGSLALFVLALALFGRAERRFADLL